jgi:sporulation protein YqfD
VSAGPRWPGGLRPRVVVWLEGRRPERALERALARGVQIEAVRSLARGRLEILLSPAMLAPLRQAVRGRARVRVRQRQGGPYLTRILARRPGLWLGAPAFVASLCVLGSMVWAVRVVGVPAALGQRVLAVAAANGVRPGAWRVAVDRDRVAAALTRSLPSLSWAGLGEDGGLIVIRAVTRLVPKAGEASGSLLVASHPGTIVAMHVRQGQADVRVGDQVQAGQILVQGYLASGGTLLDGSAAPPRYLAPHAVVVARWSAQASASAVRRVPLPVSRREDWTWMLSVHGHTLGVRPAPPGRIVTRHTFVAWRIRLWGIEWMALRVARVAAVRERVEVRPRTATTAIALRRAEQTLERTLGSEARIVSRRQQIVWQGDRVTATLEVQAEGDVARPVGGQPTSGE